MVEETAYILICSCFGQDKKAKLAFSLMFPDRVLPTVVKGRDHIYKLAQRLGNDHILAISKLSGKYAYYVKLKDGIIEEEYDLNTKRRIA